MTSVEENNHDWQEIRSRVDSISNVIFLIAGGALSLSITVILNNKSADFITKEVICLSVHAWYGLLVSVIFFLLLKTHMVFHAFMLQFAPQFVNRHLGVLNGTGWAIGLLGLFTFLFGLIQLVRSAVIAVSA